MRECESLSSPRSFPPYLSRKRIDTLLSGFGFTEIADISRFMNFVCNAKPETGDYLYLRFKVGQCLTRHDDGSEYFVPLRELATELDCMVRDFLRGII